MKLVQRRDFYDLVNAAFIARGPYGPQRMQADLLSVVEAAYRLEAPEEAWIDPGRSSRSGARPHRRALAAGRAFRERRPALFTEQHLEREIDERAVRRLEEASPVDAA